MKAQLLSFFFVVATVGSFAQQKFPTPQFSTAGFYELPHSGRQVYNMNVAWCFHKGDVSDGFKQELDDSKWSVVSLPHGLELLPYNASGGVNYQGIAWYRKHFTPDPALKGKKVFLYFEAIMGKSKVWVNGKLLTEHFGGFLPIPIDISEALVYGKDNVIAVCADNSDDPSFPPGKPQTLMDFVYFGGIYRDCWLISENQVHITDPNYENTVGGGGLLVHFPVVNEKESQLALAVQVRNELPKNFKGSVQFVLRDRDNHAAAQLKKTFSSASNQLTTIRGTMSVKKPQLWMPDSPYLYHLEVCILDNQGKVVDGYSQRIGIRSVEFRGKDGLYLNGKPFNDKLIGGNHHQDFALIGNAVPNSLQYRDVRKLRDAGMRVIRSAHYPQDPAFMDACDELGMFVIVATPGWQFWNKDSIFGQRVYCDIRNMVRRDRNRPSLFFWEPILNETRFPKDFTANAKKCVDEEFPFKGNYYAIDANSAGSALFPVIYSHPDPKIEDQTGVFEPQAVFFTREFGDNVDDWRSHNSNSRVFRGWGERPMLQQAQHYADPSYPFTSIETIYEAPKYHIGGTLWHPFDHQRGYHPQPFYGGIMDAFRQAKDSYYMFMAQRPPVVNKNVPAETGPMVYIANEMTPFSPEDVTVYSNCEEVRLTVFEGGKQYTYKRSSSDLKMPSPIITFKDAFHFMELKKLARDHRRKDIYMLAEGLMDGKVVASYKREPSARPTKLVLRVDDDGLALKADGSDIVTVIAELTDDSGNVKRLNDSEVKFTVTGEGHILGGSDIGANPEFLQWGSAPILVQSTTRPGPITVHVESLRSGINTAAPAEITFESKPAEERFIYRLDDLQRIKSTSSNNNSTSEENGDLNTLKRENEALKKKLNDYELKVVEHQQNDFGEKR